MYISEFYSDMRVAFNGLVYWKLMNLFKNKEIKLDDDMKDKLRFIDPPHSYTLILKHFKYFCIISTFIIMLMSTQSNAQISISLMSTP